VADAQKIITVHGGVAPDLMNRILTDLERALDAVGATRVQIDPSTHYDTTVLAVLPHPRQG